jgi:hypothetical protein
MAFIAGYIHSRRSNKTKTKGKYINDTNQYIDEFAPPLLQKLVLNWHPPKEILGVIIDIGLFTPSCEVR